MIDRASFARQMNIADPMNLPGVIVAGCGHVGSAVVFALAKMGCTIDVYDPDIITMDNLPSTFFALADVSKNKAVAAAEFAKVYGGIVTAHCDNFAITDEASKIIVMCVDNLPSRIRIVKLNPENFIIDTRAGNNKAIVDVIDPAAPETVEKWFEDAAQRPSASIACGSRSVMYISFWIAAQVGAIIAARAHGRCYPERTAISFTTFTNEIEINYKTLRRTT